MLHKIDYQNIIVEVRRIIYNSEQYFVDVALNSTAAAAATSDSGKDQKQRFSRFVRSIDNSQIEDSMNDSRKPRTLESEY